MIHVQSSVVNEDEIDTVLDSDIEFSGTLEAGKSLLIKGRVYGKIVCKEELYIAAEADVDAEIEAPQVTVRGTLKGKVRAAQSIQVLSGSRVSASLEAPEIFIEDEENFEGTATISGNEENA